MTRWYLAAFFLVTGIVGYCLGRGQEALTGLILGILATSVDLLGLWGAVRMFGRPAENPKQARFGSSLLILAFFMKLPVFVVLGNLSHHLGKTSDTGFLLGIGLVYSLLVGGVLAKRDRARQ